MKLENHTEHYNGYLVTTDKSLMKVSDIHRWLSEEAYWSREIPFETVRTAFENSYCIGVLDGDRQVGFGRLVTDYATFAYLADVYVEEAHRGKGLSKRMMEILFSMDWVNGLRRMMLSTIHAHELYRKYGFTACRYPDRLMEVLLPPDMYKAQRQ
jgi:GNAT superfamily N-acetyltransferase